MTIKQTAPSHRLLPTPQARVIVIVCRRLRVDERCFNLQSGGVMNQTLARDKKVNPKSEEGKAKARVSAAK
jgi:hypothetical protein